MKIQIEEEVNENDQNLIQDFMKEVDKIQRQLDRMKANNERILDLSEQHTNAASSDVERRISDELNMIIKQNRDYQSQIKSTLEKMNVEVLESENKFPVN